MSSFSSKLFSLISNNEALFEFVNTYAIDGCWIVENTQKEDVYIDKELSILLGENTPTVPMERISNEVSVESIYALFKESPTAFSDTSQTINISHRDGTSLFHQLKYFVVDDEGTKFIIGGHQSVFSEHELIEERKKFRNIIDGTGLGTWEWNVQTGACIFNERWAEIIGFELEELQPVSIETWGKYAHPEDLVESGVALNAHFEGKSDIYEFESRMQHRDGHWVWVLDKGRVFTWTKDGKPEWMVGSHQDITQRKRQELELSKYKDLLDQTTKVAGIGVWEVSLIDNEVFWGATTKAIHEVPMDYEPLFEEAVSFYPEGENRNKILEHFNRATEKNIPYDIELQIATYHKTLKWVRAIGIPEFEKGKCVRVFGIFQDIDKIKQDSLKSNELIESTQEQNNRLMNFAYIVGHNLRSHSNNFSMLTNLLSQNIAEEKKQKVMDMLLSASDRLKDTIVHLDEVVNINLSLQENLTNLSLNKFIKSTVDSQSTLAAKTAIKINLNLDKEYVVFGVAAYLESLTLNFLSNAIKYADPKKQQKYVNITAEQIEDEVLLKFEDNGLGMDLEKHGSKLFGMYNTFHKVADSRGIGLFITRNQVEAMGGRISVNSKVGVGTTFTVHLKAEVR